MRKISQKNYDLVFKEAFSIFDNRSLAFLGIDLPPIHSFLVTEIPEVETTDDMMDLNFRLEDGSILHLEEEMNLSKRDLIRFAHYDLRLFRYYDAPVHTVVLTPANSTSGTKVLDIGSLQYNVLQIVLSDRDGDALLSQMQNALEKGEQVNELELIFLPLMKSELTKTELLRKTIELEKQLPIKDIRNKVRELTLILADKIVDKKLLDELWEELRMLKVVKYAEEKGMERGKETVAKNLLSKGMDDEFVIETTGLDQSIIDKLKKSLSSGA